MARRASLHLVQPFKLKISRSKKRCTPKSDVSYEKVDFEEREGVFPNTNSSDFSRLPSAKIIIIPSLEAQLKIQRSPHRRLKVGLKLEN